MDGIDVTLHEDDGFLVLQVSDTGIGISLEDQRRIFDKFYRVESEATERIGGTGLGLSIVKAIVKKHSGRVWVQSELGKGSTFTVLLPRYADGKEIEHMTERLYYSDAYLRTFAGAGCRSAGGERPAGGHSGSHRRSIPKAADSPPIAAR